MLQLCGDGQGWANDIVDLNEIAIGVASFIAINDGIDLEKFIRVFLCLPGPPRIDTQSRRFRQVDASNPPLKIAIAVETSCISG